MARDSNVLVIGDWFVDAHWVVAPHRSDSASRPGRSFSLGLQGLDSTVRCLCGAGQVASLLELSDKESSGIGAYGAIYGIGSWHADDGALIQAMLDPDNCRGDNPNRLKNPTKTEGPLRLYSIGSNDAGTNRVMRIYRRTADDEYEQMDRIDWEIPLKEPCEERLDNALNGIANIGFVVIKDHGRGVINPGFIKRLRSKIDGPGCMQHWFVETKDWNAPWLSELPKDRVRLVLMPHEAAIKARLTSPSGEERRIHNWLLSDSVPTKRAMEFMQDSLLKRFPEAAILVMPSRNTLCGIIPHEPRGFVHRGERENNPEPFVPRASVLFAALFHHFAVDLANCPNAKGEKLPAWIGPVRQSIDFTDQWVHRESGRISNPQQWGGNDVRLGKTPPVRNPEEIGLSFDWDKVWRSHAHAFAAWPEMWSGKSEDRPQGYGVVQVKEELRLDLWRPMEVQGCITCVRLKRQMLEDLTLHFSEFMKGDRRTHQSFYICDDPGGGKSTMVRKLAEALDMKFLSFNITEMVRRNDLLGCFDTIVTTQAQEPDRPLLVFVDEINANLEGHSVYSAFLAPLEDGHYNRDGKTFQLTPCVWVFVGTEDFVDTGRGKAPTQINMPYRTALEGFIKATKGPTETIEKISDSAEKTKIREDRARKERDFISRLTVPPFILNAPTKLPASALKEAEYAIGADLDEEETLVRLGRHKTLLKLANSHLVQQGRALERVYIGAATIKRFFPDVEWLSIFVLEALACLPNEFTLRRITKLIERCNGVCRGVLLLKNFPEEFLANTVGKRWELLGNGFVKQTDVRMADLSKMEGERLNGPPRPGTSDYLVKVCTQIQKDRSWTFL